MKILATVLLLSVSAAAQITNGSQQTFNSSTGVQWQAKSVYDVRDSGVDCTGTNDSTTAFQNLINAVPNFSRIVIPQACKIKVSGSPAITIESRYGLEFEFYGRNSNNCDQPTGTTSQIFYNQSYSAGNKAIYINRSQRLRITNMTLVLNGGADIGIDVDQVGGTPPITTMNVFEDVCVSNVAAGNANFVGIRFSNTSASNVEAQHLYRPWVTCSNVNPTSGTSNGTGIVFGPSNANAVDEIIEDPLFNKCSVDINTGFGQDNFWNYGLTSSSWTNVALNGFVDGIHGLRSEAAHAAVSIGNPIGPHFLSNLFLGASAGTRIDCPTGCGKVTLFNSHTDFAPTNWFDVHSGSGSSGPLVAFNNRNFTWAPTDWNLGAFVVDSAITTSTNTHFLLTPSYVSGNLRGGNVQSPAIDLTSLSGTGVVSDSYIIQALPSGPLSNTPGSSTLEIGHANASAIAPWLAFGGSQSGATFSPVTNTGALGVVTRGAAGATSYSYVVVAHGSTGTTTASNTYTILTGNAVLNGTNFNLVQIPMVPGCTYFDVYRTASSGSPGSTGLIGQTDCFTTASIAQINASILPFSDTGLAGDGSSPPVVNTTGQIISTVPTGTAPLVIASTTNVPNLNVGSISGFTFDSPGAIGGGTPSTGAFTTVTATSVTTSAANGGISGTEGTGAGVAAGAGLDVMWPDSTAHRWMMNNNNGGNQNVTGSIDFQAVYNHSGTQQATPHIVEDSCVLGTSCSVTLTGSAVYTSSSSYQCTCADATAAAACRVNQTAGNAFAITGTGTDTIRYVCAGN